MAQKNLTLDKTNPGATNPGSPDPVGAGRTDPERIQSAWRDFAGGGLRVFTAARASASWRLGLAAAIAIAAQVAPLPVRAMEAASTFAVRHDVPQTAGAAAERGDERFETGLIPTAAPTIQGLSHLNRMMERAVRAQFPGTHIVIFDRFAADARAETERVTARMGGDPDGLVSAMQTRATAIGEGGRAYPVRASDTTCLVMGFPWTPGDGTTYRDHAAVLIHEVAHCLDRASYGVKPGRDISGRALSRDMEARAQAAALSWELSQGLTSPSMIDATIRRQMAETPTDDADLVYQDLPEMVRLHDLWKTRTIPAASGAAGRTLMLDKLPSAMRDAESVAVVTDGREFVDRVSRNTILAAVTDLIQGQAHNQREAEAELDLFHAQNGDIGFVAVHAQGMAAARALSHGKDPGPLDATPLRMSLARPIDAVAFYARMRVRYGGGATGWQAALVNGARTWVRDAAAARGLDAQPVLDAIDRSVLTDGVVAGRAMAHGWSTAGLSPASPGFASPAPNPGPNLPDIDRIPEGRTPASEMTAGPALRG